MSIFVLQIGDIHIKTANDAVLARVNEIVAAVRSVRVEVAGCFIVVPGDVTFSGRPDQYQTAELFLRELGSSLEQEFPGIAVQFVFVPGNHDCDLTKASDIRKSRSIRNSLDSLDFGGGFIKEQLAVQEAFFEFTAKFGQVQETPKDRLFTRRILLADRRYSLAFNCYNTAWLSDNPENPGELSFPLALLNPKDQRPVDVEIAVFHHPYNWLEPNNAQRFRAYIEGRSDIVLTGHEHCYDAYAKTRTGSTVEYLAGQALFDPTADSNGFNLLSLDLTHKQWRIHTFSWAGDAYFPVNQTEGLRPFLRARAVLNSGFVNNQDYKDSLTDVGTGFTHSRKHLRLHDIFVYPSLTQRVLQQKLKIATDVPVRIKPHELIDVLLSQRRLFIFGADRSGKTALARTIYARLQAQTDCVPVLINGQEMTKQDWTSHTVDNAFVLQYDRGALERYKQLPSSRRALIIDDLDAAPLARRTLGETIDLASGFFGILILIADEYLDIDQVVNARHRPILQEFPQYQIDEFGRVPRGKLIERWVTLGRADPDDDSLHREIEQRERTVETLLGRQLLPSYPIIILAILQAMETARNLNTASGSYGELYEALITDRLVSVSKKATDLGTKYTVISRIAYFLFRQDAETFTKSELSAVLQDYFAEYDVRLNTDNIVEELVTAGILREMDGNFAFKYPYYYHFFVARYFRDNIRDTKERIALERPGESYDG